MMLNLIFIYSQFALLDITHCVTVLYHSNAQID